MAVPLPFQGSLIKTYSSEASLSARSVVLNLPHSSSCRAGPDHNAILWPLHNCNLMCDLKGVVSPRLRATTLGPQCQLTWLCTCHVASQGLPARSAICSPPTSWVLGQCPHQEGASQGSRKETRSGGSCPSTALGTWGTWTASDRLSLQEAPAVIGLRMGCCGSSLSWALAALPGSLALSREPRKKSGCWVSNPRQMAEGLVNQSRPGHWVLPASLRTFLTGIHCPEP